MGNDQFKKELKIEASITPEDRVEMITLLQEYTDVLRGYAWFGYGYRSTQNIVSRRMQTGQIKVEKDSS
jgi:hypothetical protein